MPLSLIGTFAVMYLAHFSLNNLSLMALTIATGFVVDDAIVMIENISRYLEQGDTPLEAALKGVGADRLHHHLADRLAGRGADSAAVHAGCGRPPVPRIRGHAGRDHPDLGASCRSRWCRCCARRLLQASPGQAQHVAQYGDAGPWFARIVDWYGKRLTWVLDHQRLTLWVAVGTLALTASLYVVIPKGFFPDQDTGLIQGVSEATQSISYAAMADRQQALAAAILKDPDVAEPVVVHRRRRQQRHAQQRPLPDQPQAACGSAQRPRAEVARRIQARDRTTSPGITLYMQPVQDLTLDTTVSRTQYQFTLESADPAALSTWTPKLVAQLRQQPELADVVSNQEDNGLAAYVTIDRDSAARLGISVGTVDNALYDAFGQRIVSTIFTQSNQYRVIIEADPASYRLAAVAGLDLRALGRRRPGAAVGDRHGRAKTRPLLINHLAQFPATTVSFNLAPGASLGRRASTPSRARERAIGLPASISTTFQGAALAFRNNLTNELLLLLAAVLVMYIVLGVLYESFIHPDHHSLHAALGRHRRAAGADAGGDDLTIIALIGIILLIGIVKKNAILMIDFAIDAERDEGLSPREAIYQACLLRFRPILMTTVAAIFGALPLMFGTGTGSELRHPAGRQHRRRTAGEPGADAVHDAGDLPGVRSARRTRRDRPRAADARREHLGALHRSPGRDDPADARRGAVRWRRPSSCCRWRRCRRSTCRPSSSRPSFRARARK